MVVNILIVCSSINIFVISIQYNIAYNKKALPVQRGGVHMALAVLSFVGSFILSVIASIVANYITNKMKR